MSEIIQIMHMGMLDDMKQLDTISHNLANVSTPGYKRAIGFQQLMQSSETAMPQSQYNAVLDFSTGALKHTGQPLDVAIEGRGLFAVRDAGGGLLYTRQGGFQRDANGFLTAANGYKVLSANGGDIQLNTDHPRIDNQGRIWENNQFIAQLKLVDVPSAQDIKQAGSGYYRAMNGALPNIEEQTMSLRQAYLEGSNVQSMDEMVKMIGTMRHFETGQKVINIYDNTMNRAIRSLAEF